MTATNYDASSIEVLEGLDAVRKRPGMYIGSTGSGGLTHLLWEIIDNAVDEAAADHCDLIEVTLHPDGSYEVADNGRGIPIDRKDGDQTALEVVFTELHAGGKFGNGAYGASGGLHGVGSSVVNALSRALVVDVNRGGHTHRLEFRDRVAGHTRSGRFVPSHKLEKVAKVPRGRTGTRVRFWPDTDIFDSEARIDYQEVRDRLSQVCFLVPGLKIRLTDRRNGGNLKPEEFVSKGGLADFVDFLTGDIAQVTGLVRLTGSGEFKEKVPVDGKLTEVTRTCSVDIALRWAADYDTRIVSFVNTIPTPDGGTHVAGFERALTFAVNDILKTTDPRKLRRLRDNGKAQKEDVQEGLVAVIRATFPEPQFRGQTKRELGTPDVQRIVYDIAKSCLSTWLSGTQRGSKVHVRAVLDKITDAIINRVSTRQALETKRKAASLGNNGMPDKLADCRIHPGGELLIVEGDSAGGSAKEARDPRTMAILPIRGKILNVERARIERMYKNTEVLALISAIGAGVGEAFDVAKIRYHKVILLCDADVDGSHIRTLLLTFFFRQMREMVAAGHVYIAQPPLYSTKVGSETVYLKNDDAKDAFLAERTNHKNEFQRLKGLGEMDADELWDTTMDPATRTLLRVTMEEAVTADEVFSTLMGENVELRKKFIQTNAHDVRFLDI